MERVEGAYRALRFVIEGLLAWIRLPEPVRFDTVLELGKGQYEVKGTTVRNELRTYYESELHVSAPDRSGVCRQVSQELPRDCCWNRIRCEDPHVERMIESFALLAARVHLRIDDDFPQITEALLNILYPHYLCPIPSMSVAEFSYRSGARQDDQQPAGSKGSVLYSRPVEGVPCKFRTCYNTTLWPLKVSQAQWLTPDRLSPSAAVFRCRRVAR